ncbi:metallophosphoesterase family protein [Dialister sp. UBA1703]|uniref:metallophosphoesterase family protein n=1 Tax=Dialister sp. UBA1703 TaxID=1946415 RepID=UPI0025BFEE3B|nr:metallophosphoesterase [Dialister sp. UBA1703]
MFRTILCFFLSLSCLVLAGCGQLPAPAGKEYERVVVISDLHYPSKTRDNPKRQAIMDNKAKAREDINSWQDVDLKVFTGDMVEMYGSMNQMEEAKQFIDGFAGEKAYLAGNHELFYKEELKDGKPVMADPALRKAHEDNYRKVFGPLHSTKTLGQYLLVFLSPEDTESRFPVAMAKEEMDWLRQTLKENQNTPTLIFYHAPLSDTMIPYNDKIGNPRNFAQPAGDIDLILLTNPQVKLWVSGHTHTPPTQPTFASEVNYYHGKVLDVYNPTWDGKQVWSNSIYLYKDKIVIKTYDHKKGAWMDELTRTVML